MIVMDLHNPDHYFHAFRYPEGVHLVSFGKRGEGPEEMLSAETFQFNSPDSIWVLDANKMQISRWDIQSFPPIRSETIELDKRLVRTLDFYSTNSGFFVPDYLGECRYHQLNKQGQIIRSAGSIPTNKQYKEIARPALAQAWRSFMDYHPQNEILVMGTQLGEILEIYQLRDTLSSAYKGKNGEPEFEISDGEGIPTGIMGFSDIQITDKYIYTVFHGRSFKEIIVGHQKGEKREDGGRYIYVFDLQGSPVCKYILDRAVYGIDVHEETNTIITTDINSDEPIVLYKM